MRQDHGDRSQVRQRKTKQQLEEERCREELRKLLQHRGNRYFLWRLLSECSVFHSTSVPNPSDMAIRSGKRDAGIWVLTEILNADESAYFKMTSEAREREKQNNG